MVDTRKINDRILLIDDNLYSVPGSGSIYLLAEEKKALIDCGPATSINTIMEGIRQIGFKSEEIDYIIITHIHLDHSGGAGTLLKYMPRAKVIAHYKAARHLIDPSRLISSAISAQSAKALENSGEVLPVPEERIISVHDCDSLSLSDRQILTFLETPGHAPHELCILESRNRGIFVGDAVGHFIEGSDIMVPVTPPPSFDMEQYLRSLERLMKLGAKQIYFAHAGTSQDVEGKLRTAAKKLRERHEVISRAAAENKLDLANDILTEHICGELEWVKKNRRSIYDCWAAGDIPMSAIEHVRYYRARKEHKGK